MVLYLVIDQFFSSKKAQKAYFLSNDFVWLSLCFVLVRVGYWRAHLHMGPTLPSRGSLGCWHLQRSEVLSGPHRCFPGRRWCGVSPILGELCTLVTVHWARITLLPEEGSTQGGCAGARALTGHMVLLRGQTADTPACRPRALSQLLSLWPESSHRQRDGCGRAPLKHYRHWHLNFRYFSYIAK